jgi:hypothetical protein
MFNAITDAHYAGGLAQGAPAAGRDVCRDDISFMAILGMVGAGLIGLNSMSRNSSRSGPDARVRYGKRRI